MNKRIILVGPAAAGKDFLKNKFGNRGFKLDVSYTTRSIREGEEYGVDYNYISEDEFTLRISQGAFYEWAKHGNYKYATGLYEWNNCDVFIMETHGISEITPEDRKNCFIIYLNPPYNIREKRMIETRKWSIDDIMKRGILDHEKFNKFKDFDIEISDPNF